MEDTDPARTTRLALLFEGGLGVAAIGVGWLVGQWPLVGLSTGTEQTQVEAIGWGLIGTGPLLLVLFLIERFPFGPLRHLSETTNEVIWRMFGGASVAQLAVVAIAAGFGEELLFRGLMQAGISGWLGPGIGLAAASVLLGICHWLNATYAVLATAAGAYFGLLLLTTGNILTPIVAHAAYDFLAIVYLIRPGRLIGSK